MKLQVTSVIKYGLIATVLLPATAASKPAFRTSAPVAYMVDLSSGSVLYSRGERHQIAPASMAKMMTAYVAFDRLAKEKLTLDRKFSVTPEIWQKWNNRGSTMFLREKEQVSVEKLLQGLITVSANDAAITLANGIAGSEKEFVAQMNDMAQRLGMRDSHFATANGWPDGGKTQVTARDLGILARRTIEDFPLLYHKFYGAHSFTWNGIRQADRNPLLGNVEGADGMKTGFSDDAGYCFTGSARRDGRRIITVLAGMASAEERKTEAVRFMHWGFAAWRSHPLYRENQIVTQIPVQLGNMRQVSVKAKRSFAITLPARENLRYRLFVRYRGPVKAPVRKDDEVADLVVRLSDGSEQIMPLLAADDVRSAGFFGRILNGLHNLTGI